MLSVSLRGPKRVQRAQDGDKERLLNVLLVCFHTEHTLCIIKRVLNQAINTHTAPDLLGLVTMVTSVRSAQTQLVTVMAVRYGGENKAAPKHLIIPSVCLRMHLKRQGKKIIIIIDPCIDSQLQITLYSPIHQCLCEDGAVLVFQTLCRLFAPSQSR